MFLISSSHSVLKLRYRAPYSDYKIFSYPQQIQSSISLFLICVYECLKNIHMYTELYLSTAFQSWNMDPLLWTFSTIHKYQRWLKMRWSNSWNGRWWKIGAWECIGLVFSNDWPSLFSKLSVEMWRHEFRVLMNN